MKALKPFWILLVILLLMVAFSYFNASGESDHERIQWRTDFKSAVTESQSTHKPLFLYFTATWCEPCQSLKHTTWASADVEKELSNFVPVKIDVDEHPDLVKEYPSDGIPHFVIAKEDGTMLRETVGAYPPKEFIDWLDGKTM
jgi:thiol:disulfide interchange protein